ncbi:VCBS repeat-containing protein [Streptomyces sp. M10(2022)]
MYGSATRGLEPGTRQLLSARANAAKSGDTLPAAFDSQASCDLDRDSFTDLVVATDPVQRHRPPARAAAGPLRLPGGLTGKAVTLRIPDKARVGNEWPDHPVCGDFNGDGRTDLVVTTGEGRISFLRGPFTRSGAPAAPSPCPAAAPISRHPPRRPTRTATATTTSSTPPSPTGPVRPPREAAAGHPQRSGPHRRRVPLQGPGERHPHGPSAPPRTLPCSVTRTTTATRTRTPSSARTGRDDGPDRPVPGRHPGPRQDHVLHGALPALTAREFGSGRPPGSPRGCHSSAAKAPLFPGSHTAPTWTRYVRYVAGFRIGRGRDNRTPQQHPQQQQPYGTQAPPPPYGQQAWPRQGQRRTVQRRAQRQQT